MRVQIGTQSLPIILTPRIKGLLVTVSLIKSTYSNQFVNDASTPLNFFIEYEPRPVAGAPPAPVVVAWNPALSTDSLIYFPVPDSLYATEVTYTIIFYWTVVNGPVTEKIFSEERLELQVQDLHNNPG